MLCRLFHLVFCVEYALVFFLPPPTPGEIYRCEKGDVHEKMGFHRVLSCVDVLVDITVVAVKRLIREKLYFLTVNCQPCELYLSCNRFAHPSQFASYFVYSRQFSFIHLPQFGLLNILALRPRSRDKRSNLVCYHTFKLLTCTLPCY